MKGLNYVIGGLFLSALYLIFWLFHPSLFVYSDAVVLLFLLCVREYERANQKVSFPNELFFLNILLLVLDVLGVLLILFGVDVSEYLDNESPTKYIVRTTLWIVAAIPTYYFWHKERQEYLKQ